MISRGDVLICNENGSSEIIPRSLGRLSKLTVLALGSKGLWGTIPSLVFNLFSLIAIYELDP